jgi:hypothetical protein
MYVAFDSGYNAEKRFVVAEGYRREPFVASTLSLTYSRASTEENALEERPV